MNAMSCQRLNDCLDAYLDDDIQCAERSALEEHVAACVDCSKHLARERALQAAVCKHPVVEPSADFFEQALGRAAREGRRVRQRNRWMVGIGGAVAASLAIWLAVMPPTRTLQPRAVAAIATVTLALHETRTVKLVFGSATAIPEARLSLRLPPGVELAGYRGRQVVHWKTSLRPGKNVLPIELILQEGSGGDLIARLEQAGKHKTFRMRVAIASTQTGLKASNGSQQS